MRREAEYIHSEREVHGRREVDTALFSRAPSSSSPTSIVLPLTSKKTMPGTSLRVLCRFSNDLKYCVWRIVPSVSRNCVLITNASDRVIIFQRGSSREKLASPRNRDTLLRAYLIERVISRSSRFALKSGKNKHFWRNSKKKSNREIYSVKKIFQRVHIGAILRPLPYYYIEWSKKKSR